MTMLKVVIFGILSASVHAFVLSGNANKWHGTALSMTNGRRQFMQSFVSSIIVSGIVVSKADFVDALDVDAFINGELATDTKNCDPKKDPKCHV